MIATIPSRWNSRDFSYWTCADVHLSYFYWKFSSSATSPQSNGGHCMLDNELFLKCFRATQSIFAVTGQGNLSQEEWEERILHLAMDVLSETMLGIRLSGHSFLQWRFEVLKEER